ncbi:hypothetical protein HK096_001544, partial [Nowakowskiella sp. JEL0078]
EFEALRVETEVSKSVDSVKSPQPKAAPQKNQFSPLQTTIQPPPSNQEFSNAQNLTRYSYQPGIPSNQSQQPLGSQNSANYNYNQSVTPQNRPPQAPQQQPTGFTATQPIQRPTQYPQQGNPAQNPYIQQPTRYNPPK